MQNKMTEGNVIRALAAFTVPLILSGLFQQLFNWVDAFIVGNVEGETALAGIGATTSVYNLFVTVITGFASGLSVLTAQRYGMGEKGKIRELLSSYTVLFALLFTVISAAGGSVYRETSCCSGYAGDDLFQRPELSEDSLCRDSASRCL